MHNPTTPYTQRLQAYIYMVWATPGSLAATTGIVVTFFSWRYLDVSVPLVRLIYLCIQYMMTEFEFSRVSPFGILRVKAC